MNNWKKELLKRIEMDGELDEKHAKGVYDMALDMTDKIYNILKDNNTLNDIADTYFPDVEICDYIYNTIKYGE